MPKVLLSRQAEADLDDVWDYLESRNPDAALRVIGEINGVFELISNFPLMEGRTTNWTVNRGSFRCGTIWSSMRSCRMWECRFFAFITRRAIPAAF
jgi:plasmid stabilization system protein ParE